MDKRIFLLGSTMNTARADNGIPLLSSSLGSNIPKDVDNVRDSSSIIGYGNRSTGTSA